jgi:hypothetical protein
MKHNATGERILVASGWYMGVFPQVGGRINPLTPELNLSVQRCLTRFLLGILLT